MVTVATVADRMLSESGFTYDVIDDTEATALTIVEYLIDKVIDWVNLQTGSNIADLTGTAASKSLVGSEDEVTVVKLGSELYIRIRQTTDPNVSIGSLSITQNTGDPYIDFLITQFRDALETLKLLNEYYPKEIEADHG